MFIDIIKKKYKKDIPIFTADILALLPNYTRAYVFRMINKAVDSGDLIKFSRGIYYLPRKTVVGISSITADDVVQKRYIASSGKVLGIYSGISLLNKFFITTQVPNTIEIVTNNETMRKRVVDIDGRFFILRKSRFPITNDNVAIYTILQLFTCIESIEELDSFSRKKIIEYISEKQINKNELLSKSVVFPVCTLKNIIRSGVLNEIA